MRKLVVILPAALAACQPATTSPARVVAMIQTTTGAYAPREVDLTTMKDAVAISGSVATFTGGARIVEDPSDPLLQTNGGNLTADQIAAVFVKAKGIPPRGSYIEQNGVLWPADFHTWNMVSAYYAFEKAFQYWQTVGVPAAESGTAEVYYFPTYINVPVSPNPLNDNALFDSPVQAFLLLPFDDKLQQVPLAMNLGVLGHEYSHRVWNKRVYDGQNLPGPITQWTGTPLNILKSIDEGFADWNGYGVSCNGPFGCTTRFLQPSLGASAADARDMALNTQCMTQGLWNAMTGNTGSDTFLGTGQHYHVGTVLASSLYHAAIATGQTGVIQRAVLDAYNDLNPTSPGLEQLIQQNLASPDGAVTLPAVLGTILSHLTDPELQRRMCNEFLDRFGYSVGWRPSDIPNCPASSGPGQTTACCAAAGACQ